MNKNNLIFNFDYQVERISPNQSTFSVDLRASTNFFAHPVIPTFRLDHYGRTNGRMDQRMDGGTDGWTDKASYRVACPQLKI